MRVLVTFAVDAEFDPWCKRHAFEIRRIRTRSFQSREQTAYAGRVGHSAVDVFLTGMGWERYGSNTARHGLRSLLQENPAVFISTGLAGGLKPVYRVPDVVVPATVSSYHGGNIRNHAALSKIALACGAKAVEKMISWNHVVAEGKAKRALGLFADVVDMESYFVMTAVSGARVPSIAVRAISDTCAEDLPIDFSRVLDRKGSLKKRELLVELSRHPGRIPALLGFGRRSRGAATRLADFLDNFIPAIEEEFARRQPRENSKAAAR